MEVERIANFVGGPGPREIDVGDLAERRVLVVGAGSMGALAGATLAARGAGGVRCEIRIVELRGGGR